jgi:hypothetical protein
MSFTDTPADQATPNVTADQPISFNVGERTFNAESATTKIQAADEHIARLEAENASYKAKVEQSTSIDEALAQLREQNVAPTQNSQTTEHTSPVSEEQIGEIAKKQMAEYLAAQRIESNATAAQALAESTYKETGEKLTAIYGDKTDEAMAVKAKELGITTQALFDMAKTPATAQLLLQTMQVNSAPSQSSPQGGYNSAPLVNQQAEKFVDYSKPITSSTLTDALKRAGGTY